MSDTPAHSHKLVITPNGVTPPLEAEGVRSWPVKSWQTVIRGSRFAHRHITNFDADAATVAIGGVDHTLRNNEDLSMRGDPHVILASDAGFVLLWPDACVVAPTTTECFEWLDALIEEGVSPQPASIDDDTELSALAWEAFGDVEHDIIRLRTEKTDET